MRCRIDIENHGLHDLSLFQHLGRMFHAFGPRQVGNVNQPVDTLFDFDKCAEIRHITDTALHYRADAVALINGGPGIGFELFQPERDAALFGMNLEHHGLYLITGLDHFGGMLHPPGPGHLADMDEAFHACFELDKRSVIGDVDHSPDHSAVDPITLRHRFPRVRIELLDAQRDALPAAIELQHLDGDLIPDMQNLGGMIQAAVRHVGDVQEPVDAAQIDERSIVRQIFDHTGYHCIFREMFQSGALADIDFLFNGGTPGYTPVAAQ